MNLSLRLQRVHPIVVAVLFALSGLAAEARADKVVLVAGGGPGGDGAWAAQGKISGPFGVAFDKAGNMFIGEFAGHRVRKIDTRGILSTIAGTGEKGFGGDGGQALNCQFNFIHDIVMGPDGNLYVADSLNRRIRKIDLATGIITTFAGADEEKASTGDGGSADKANFDGVASLWFSNDGGTLYATGFSTVVRAIDMKTQVISTVKDLPGGRSIAVDSKGNLYVAGATTLSVRSPDGAVKVLIDKTNLGGSNLPLAAYPKHLGIDAQDNVLICDEQHHMLRKYVALEGKLVTLMGNGKPGTAGVGGPAAMAQLKNPHGVLFHHGVIYIADSMNNRVLKIEP